MTHFEEGFIFTWKIENFSMLPHQKGEKLESPTFVVETLDKTKWCLSLYPKGDDRVESDNYILLFLTIVDFDTKNTSSKLRCTFTLEAVDSAFEKSMPIQNVVIDVKIIGKGYPKFQELKFYYNKNMYLPQDVLTIRCHICPYPEICKAPAITTNSSTLSNYFEKRCSATTRIEVQRRTLTWPITKISELCESQEKNSINLVSSLEDSPALKLVFYIDKELNDEFAQIDILQWRSPGPQQQLFVKCKITVVTADKEYQISHEASHLFCSDLNKKLFFPEFILIHCLNDGKYTYLNNTMFLQCEFTFSHKGSVHHLELPMYMPNSFQGKEAPELTQLSSSIGDLFMKEQFCDVEIRVGEKTFPCHKVVLCAQSPVFSAMFENDLKEKETGVVEITDLDPRTLQKMLKFLYLEVMEDGLPTEEIGKLYSAADKYEVLPLQRQCSLLFLSTLSVASVCNVLIIADSHRHQDNFLWTHVNNFLSIHSREVFHSPQWKTFMVDYPTLWKEIMIKICIE